MTVLITGAARGLGASLAQQALERGRTVLGIDRDWENAEAVSDNGIHRITCDLTDLAAVSQLSEELKSHAPFETVIHNAAISATGPFETIPPDAHKRLIDVNVKAPMLLTQDVVKSKMMANRGTLVFMASLSVAIGYPGAASYAASKAALANYAKSLRRALGPQKIAVLTVFPGPLKTDQAARHAPAGADEEKRMSPDFAASEIWYAIKAGKKTLTPGVQNQAFSTLGKIAPGMMSRAMRKIIYEKLDRSIY
ncbi:MAG: SDR family NAD(P)-dependent oxidoreductase [Pseudomonadota bacterium]